MYSLSIISEIYNLVDQLSSLGIRGYIYILFSTEGSGFSVS